MWLLGGVSEGTRLNRKSERTPRLSALSRIQAHRSRLPRPGLCVSQTYPRPVVTPRLAAQVAICVGVTSSTSSQSRWRVLPPLTQGSDFPILSICYLCWPLVQMSAKNSRCRAPRPLRSPHLDPTTSIPCVVTPGCRGERAHYPGSAIHRPLKPHPLVYFTRVN